MRKYLKKTIAIPLLIITIIFAGISCRKTEPTNPTPPATLNPAVTKEIAQKPTNLVPGVTPVSAVVPVKIVESPGKIVFPDKIRVQFETAGTVERVMVDEAVRVRKGDALVSLDSVTVASLQKQVAAARVALDDAEEALKDEKEQYIPGDLIARQARITQLQKELYILQQILDDSLEFYQDKAKDLLGITVPLALLDRPPEQLVAALLSQIGVKPFWGAFQDHVRPKLEVHWEQINRLQDQGLQLQQTLRNIQQQKDDITSGYSETKAQAAMQIIQRKNEFTMRQRENAVLQRDSALVQLDQVRIIYRNQIRDLLGFTVPREIGNGFYIHLQKGSGAPVQAIEEELAKHVKSILDMSLESQELSSLPPEMLVSRFIASSEGQDHILDFFLRQKLQGAWLSLSQARQKQHERNTTRDQVFGQYLRAFTQGGSD
ncbi:MAG: hypothetical protein HW384_1110, partial [Dehalococcoidia bacterium]|nr:hypothetical protein [Dehalococcoidia bacterium]